MSKLNYTKLLKKTFRVSQRLKQEESVWLLESDKKIVWVLGHAIDDRFKIIPSSKDILTLALKSAAR